MATTKKTCPDNGLFRSETPELTGNNPTPGQDIFRLLFEQTADALLLLDVKSNEFVDCNAAAIRMLGYPGKAGMLPLHPASLSPARQPDGRASREKADEMIATALKSGSHRFEWIHCSPHRPDFPVEVLLTPIQLGGNRLILTTWRDSTERKLAETALAMSRQHLATLIQSVEGIVWEADAQTFGFTFVSQRAERLLGYPCARWLNEPTFWSEHIHPEDRDRAVQFCAAATAEKRNHEFEYRMLAADGRVVWLRDIVNVVVEHDQPTKLRGIMVDITERKQAGELLLEQATVIDHSPIAIVITDLAHRVTYCNKGAVQLYGLAREELLGKTADELFSAETMIHLGAGRAAALATGRWSGEVPIISRHGRRVQAEFLMAMIVDDTGRPKARLSIATDLTDKKMLEEQFFRAQRLESLGMLAAGIAHDLNNVLTPILMVGPMLRMRATDPMDLRLLETLERSAERGAGLVRQILSFAHGNAGEMKALQIRHLVRDISTLIEETFPKSIQLEQNIPNDLWPVSANPTKIHQVLLNLCVNARDAMPDGGTLSLLGTNCRLDAAQAAAIPGGRPGLFVVIEVRDNGTGIPPEVFARIWEPFFTTKGEGKGTGLGLSTVRGIVENHRGFIALQTKAGAGTTFQVYLPAAEADDQAPASAHPFLSRGNGELLLLVDDETANRDVAQATLARHGYRVLVAASGAEAVSMFIPRAGEIRLVITDVHMPTIDGAALSHILQRFKPGLAILAMSGLSSASGSEAEAPGQFASDFLAKPFKPEALLSKVHALLQRSCPPPAGP